MALPRASLGELVKPWMERAEGVQLGLVRDAVVLEPLLLLDRALLKEA